jgi:hypothetical protein
MEVPMARLQVVDNALVKTNWDRGPDAVIARRLRLLRRREDTLRAQIKRLLLRPSRGRKHLVGRFYALRKKYEELERIQAEILGLEFL